MQSKQKGTRGHPGPGAEASLGRHSFGGGLLGFLLHFSCSAPLHHSFREAISSQAPSHHTPGLSFDFIYAQAFSCVIANLRPRIYRDQPGYLLIGQGPQDTYTRNKCLLSPYFMPQLREMSEFGQLSRPENRKTGFCVAFYSPSKSTVGLMQAIALHRQPQFCQSDL